MKCLIPSTIGLVLFLVPLNIEGNNSIPLAYIANKAVEVLGGSANWVLLAVVVISTIVPILLINRAHSQDLPKWLAPIINVGGITIVVRAVAVLFTLSVLSKVGPEWLWGEFTGGLVINVLLVKLLSIFLSYYASAVVITIILALVLSRIPPLTRFEDTFIDGEQQGTPRVEQGRLIQRALSAALKRAKTGPGVARYATLGIRDLSNLWFNVVPPTLAFATIAMILVEHTSLFEWLAVPFVPLMQLANMENPTLTAKAIVAGFADPFFPPLIGKSIESEVTRCVIAIMSVVQLIFLTETGVVLMKTQLRIRVWHLAALFLSRTLLAFPLAVMAAHLIV